MGSVTHQPKAGELLTGAEYEAADHHVIDLTAADVGAAASDHDHDLDYSALGHTHDYEASGAVATHAGAADPHTGYQKESEKGQASGYASLDGSTKVPIAQLPTGTTGTTVALGNAAAGLISTHEGAADPHTGYLKESDANWVDLTDGGATSLHTHAGGSEAFPVGSVFIAVVSTDPGTLLGYGTWQAFGAGRVLVGRDSGDTDFDTAEETGGAKTKAISAHSGTAVGDHAAHTHSYSTVLNHTHDVTVTDPGHTHDQMRFPTATGASTGFTVDTSMSGTPATANVTGSRTTGITATTANPSGGAASGTTGNPSATLTHSVTQPSGHSDLNVVQPYIVVYMWKRTA